MSRLWLMAALGSVLTFGQQPPPPQPEPKKSEQQKAEQKPDLPPEEDEAAKPEQYSFNPLKSKKDVSVGDFYLKSKKDARAAAGRYRSATRWNVNNAEAWLKLGEMDSRADVGNRGEARAAYEKYLELVPDGKNAAEVKKKLAALKAG